MSINTEVETENHIKTSGKKTNFFTKEKTKISEVIPSLLLVTEDVISPINVVLEATNTLLSGETFNDKNFLKGESVGISLPTKTHRCSEMSESGEPEFSQSQTSNKKSSQLLLDKTKFDKVLMNSPLGNVSGRRERRKSDCPARSSIRAKLDQANSPHQAGSQRIAQNRL